ncbi:MAG: hypothetical protein V1753_00405 [Pseudomonadota bacterium]
MKEDTENDTLKELALIEYFINYQSSMSFSGDDDDEKERIARFAVPKHTQWIGWLIEPADKEDDSYAV